MRIDKDNLPDAPKPGFEYALARWVMPSLTVISDDGYAGSDEGETADGQPWDIRSSIIIMQNVRLAENMFSKDALPLKLPDRHFGVIEVDTGRVGWISHDVIAGDTLELVEKDSTILNYVDSMLERRGWHPIQLDLDDLFAVRIVPSDFFGPSPDDFDDSMPDWL